MNFKELQLKLPTDYSEDLLKSQIKKSFGLQEFSYEIVNKSLDARNKGNIHWLLKIHAFSSQFKNSIKEEIQSLEISTFDRKKSVLVVGSGPAGFFSALALQKAGYQVTIIERGTDVEKRSQGIQQFEKTGIFDTKSNYAFGEGGAGTFSDGKLTSRSKHISREKQFILENYIKAGAPKEIQYLAHPHLGTDNLKIIVANLRHDFVKNGGEILFETMLEDIKIEQNKVVEIITSVGSKTADYLIVAPGHSAFETYRMLIHRGVQFRTKNFAIGFRAEHHQEIINKAQWGVEQLKGVKAAEYRLTSNPVNSLSVYTFCMCPGGMVVPATAFADTNIVNGMSYYHRDGGFANAACVAAVHPDQLLRKSAMALETLDWLENLERSFFNFSKGYDAPAIRIQDFIQKKSSGKLNPSSYPFSLISAPLWEMLPTEVSNSIRLSLTEFSRKIKGYETGTLLGLESKTSSPIQVLRTEKGHVEGVENLFIVGEGSGYAGGIISSAADGLRAIRMLLK